MKGEKKNGTILKNTGLLYIRILLTTAIGLAVLPILLRELGAENFGTYMAIAGMIAISGFIGLTLSTGTQRFISTYLGVGDNEQVKAVISVNSLIYGATSIALAALLYILGEIILIEFFTTEEITRKTIATIYLFSIGVFCLNFLVSGLTALFVAFEDFTAYSAISIAESTMKLAAATSLTVVSDNKLEVFAALNLIVSAIVLSLYLIRVFSAHRAHLPSKAIWDPKIAKDLSKFLGWTAFGAFTSIVRLQGITIIFFAVFGPTVVAGRAIAIQAANATKLLSQNFNLALYAPLVKTYAGGDSRGTNEMIFLGCKVTYFLMWVICLPLLFEIENILEIWIGDPPPGTAAFIRLSIVEVLIFSISLPLTTAARAHGDIKKYEITLGTVQLCIIPVAYIVAVISMNPLAPYFVVVAANVVMFWIRLRLVKEMIGINRKAFNKHVLFPAFCVSSASVGMTGLAQAALPTGYIGAAATIFMAVVSTITSVALFALTFEERLLIKQNFSTRLARSK